METQKGPPGPPRQILALYQQLFQAPARLDELLVAVQQVRGASGPRELELPLVLLEMERRRQEQEQLLWDLELLAGAELSLFWPRWEQFRGPWNGSKSSENHDQEPCIWAGEKEELHPQQWSLAQERDIQNGNRQLLEKWWAKGLAVMLGTARAESGTEPAQRFGSPGMPAWATLGSEPEAGTSLKADNWDLEGLPEESQREEPGEEEPRFTLEPDFTAESISRDPGQGAGRNLPEFRTQGHYQPPSWILDSPETLKPGELWSLLEGLQKRANPKQERTEIQAQVGTEISRDHKGKNLQIWRKEIPKVQRQDSPKPQKKESPQIQIQHIQREKILSAQGEISQPQTEETPKLQRGEIIWAQRNEAPRAQGEEISQSQTEETSKLQRGEKIWAQRNEAPKVQGEETSQSQTEETSKLQRGEILCAQRNEALRAQGEAILWAQVQREETPKVQRGETPWTQEEIPKVQRREISQAQREESPKAHKGKIPQVLREETAEAPHGEICQGLREEIPQIQEREKRVYGQIFHFQGSKSLHALEGENLQSHEEEVLQFQKGDIVKFWAKENLQPQGEILFPFQRKETNPSPKGDTPLFHPGEYLQSQGKTSLQPQRNKTPQDQGKAIADLCGREIPWSLGKATPQLWSQVMLGARPGGQWLLSQEAKLLKTPAQQRLREHKAVMLRVQSQQALRAAVKQGSGLAMSRPKDTGDGWFQPPSLLPNHRAVELKQHHPNPPSRELVFLSLTTNQQENTLKRLLELQGETERRHQRNREQQRLRVQERLCITRNQRLGGDLLESSLTIIQPWMQGDVAQQRCALREQLEQRHKKRKGLLQSQRERNTRNFQELLRPQKIRENPLLPALFQPSWDLRRVSNQRDGGDKGSGNLPGGQKSEVGDGQNYRKARDLTNHKGPGDPDTHTHFRGSQLCPT